MNRKEIKKHSDRLWSVATGEPVEAAHLIDIMRFRAAFAVAVKELSGGTVCGATPPRYDDVYFEGVAHLDAIARGEIEG